LVNHLAARPGERRHSPEGSFIEVDGVRLHYSDCGTGSPVVLIHGNMVAEDDYNTNGVAVLLLKTHSVIIFDQPDFGHSDRPLGRMWTARQQAELLHKALRELGIDSPARVPARFQAEYSPTISLRASQIRSTTMDGALMIPSTLGLPAGHKRLSVPVIIVAGDGDEVVFKRSAERLHAEIEGSDLQIVPGAGHMVHLLAAR
jgi:pimeloyl-ACP methyl ester carboxylesterase